MRRGTWTIALTAALAGAWSLALGVLGLWLVFETHSGWLARPWVATSAGVLSLCAAQLVFLTLVADRLFPRPDRRIRAIAQSGNTLTLAVSLVVLISASLLTSV